MTALLRDVSHAAYCTDDLPGCPHFSRSVALTLLQKSPLHAWYGHPKLGGNHVADNTDASDTGSLIHSLLLGSGPEIVVADYKDWRTNAAKEIRDTAREAGRIPILAAQWEAVQVAGSILRKNVEALGVPLDDCEREVTILWEAGGSACKARMDLLCLAVDVPEGPDAHLSGDPRAPLRQHFPVTSARIWDLKITSLTAERFRHQLVPYGLDIQAHSYAEAVAAVYPEIAGRIEFEFILCEPEPPYSVAIVPLGGSLKGLGEKRWNRALNIWRECLAGGTWPGYGRQEPAEAPTWALDTEELAAIAAAEPDWAKGA